MSDTSNDPTTNDATEFDGSNLPNEGVGETSAEQWEYPEGTFTNENTGSPAPTTVQPASEETGASPVSDAIGAPTADESGQAAASEPATTEETKQRTPASNLEGDLKQVLDGYVMGTLQLPAGARPTPHILAKEIHKLRGEQGNPPSGGAVAAALDRWTEIGYITVSATPKAFEDYTDAGRNEGLAALKKAHREKLSANRTTKRATPATPAEPNAGDAPVSDAIGAPTMEETGQAEDPPAPQGDPAYQSGNEVGETPPF